jgi:carbon monoxide dehydrogenase subunit G
MDITESFDFSAPPEVVFNNLTDPDRTDRWLPLGVRVRRLTGDRVLVEADGWSKELEVTSEPAELRLSGRATDRPDITADAVVEAGAAGGSVVRLRITAGEPNTALTRDFIREAMGRLQRDVADNFNAG